MSETYSSQGDEGIKKTVSGHQSAVFSKNLFTDYWLLITGDCFKDRPVALTARASDSKSEGWGFESLLACHFVNDSWS